MEYIVFPDDEREAELGGKAGALRALAAGDLPVPAWFCVTPAAFHASLTEAQRARLEGITDAAAWRETAEAIVAGGAVRGEIERALARLCPDGARVAVRSSAAEEDSAGQSFAGQLESFLFVAHGEVTERMADVWRSGFSERVAVYRREQGLTGAPPAPAVLVQRMLEPEVAGVAFAADPVSGRRDVAVVGAVYGVGSGLVSGDCDADTFRVDRDGNLIESSIVAKRHAHHTDPTTLEGVRRVPVPEPMINAPALSDDQARAVVELARCASHHFGRPQDIEWAIENGRLYLLQSRPITALVALPDPAGVHAIWDNSNIAESYRGVTTPLTFSFARRAYESVYREFCRLMRVPHARIAAHDDTFRNMLGLVRGRVYYNLLNWYRVLALLPGFTVNRRFMEQMMGVKESLPEDVVAGLAHASLRERVLDALYLTRTLGGLIVNYRRLPRGIARFYARLGAALASPCPPLEAQRPDELVAYYRELERRLLTRWDAPLVNDFFAMVFFGALRRFAERWCGDRDGTLQNDLLCAEGGMVSAEPARRIRALAQLAAGHPALVEALARGTRNATRRAIAAVPEFERAYREYLEKFGDRCLEELKLESATLHDDPLPLARSVGAFAERLRAASSPAPADGEHGGRPRAEARVAQALRGRPLRRLFFRWVLGQTRARVRDRENLRFERTRLFGRVRRVFLELGRRLHALDLLDSPRDVFYLSVDEILGFVEGAACSTDLKGLSRLRRAEFERYRAEPPPADRFVTRGIVYRGHDFHGMAAAAPIAGDRTKGTGCCAGVVRARVRVIADPRGRALEHGEILVAERTDPGWILLFPAAAGLLVEHGSLLSHSAIVAREMGLPAIVGIAGVTHWLRDGDLVEMDGASGVVTRLAREAGA